MIKKWRPFWSYDIDKTEDWLNKMAKEGYRLTHLNKTTRVFSFAEKSKELIKHQITYQKYEQPLPTVLKDAGWLTLLSAGNWDILQNDQKKIPLFPSRDDLVARNRLHATIWSVIAFIYAMQMILPIFILTVLWASSAAIEVESSPYWILTFIYFAQVIGVMILTIAMNRKLRKFEDKYYDIEIDRPDTVGKTIAKWKPNWMMMPRKTKRWLEKMAEQGYHLVKVQGTRFVFQKGIPVFAAYELDFQWKTEPVYTEIHKSTGWKLMHETSRTFFKTVIWFKTYDANEEKPQLIYDLMEKKKQKRKFLTGQGSLIILMLFIFSYLLWNTLKVSEYDGIGLLNGFVLGMLFLVIVLYLYSLFHLIQDALKSQS